MAWVTTNMIVLFWYVVYEGGSFELLVGGGRPQYIYIYISREISSDDDDDDEYDEYD